MRLVVAGFLMRQQAAGKRCASDAGHVTPGHARDQGHSRPLRAVLPFGCWQRDPMSQGFSCDITSRPRVAPPTRSTGLTGEVESPLANSDPESCPLALLRTMANVTRVVSIAMPRTQFAASPSLPLATGYSSASTHRRR